MAQTQSHHPTDDNDDVDSSTHDHRRPQTAHQVFQDFASETTLHGIPHIIRAQSATARVFWTVICAGACSLFLAQSIVLLEKYFTYPKKVNVEMVQKPIPFPAVSICNTDFLGLLAARRISHLLAGGDEIVDTTEDFTRRKRRSSQTNADKPGMDTFIEAYGAFWDNANMFVSFQDGGPGSLKDGFDTFSRSSLVANVGPELAAIAGVELTDFIVGCRFMHNDCVLLDSFGRVFDPYYYNCFTFKPESILDNTRMQGDEYGLNLLLFPASAGVLQTPPDLANTFIPGMQETDAALASGRGARVVIHSPRTRPHPTASGYDIPPGFSVSIGVKARENVRIGLPHGNCTPSSLSEGEDYEYTLIDCQNACIQKNIMEECKCVDIRITTNVPNEHKLPYCSKLPDLNTVCMTNLTACREEVQKVNKNTSCRKKVLENMTIRNPEMMNLCECYPPCNDIVYDTSYSLSILPENTQAHSSFYSTVHNFVRELESEKKEMLAHDNPNLTQQLRQAITRLNVHISDSNIIKTTEAPDYEPIRLVSDIGGQLGLWIGISVITIFEVFQLAADVVRFLTNKFRPRGNPQENGKLPEPPIEPTWKSDYIRANDYDFNRCDLLTTV